MLTMSEAPEIRVFLFPDAAQLATRDENFDVPQPAVPALGAAVDPLGNPDSIRKHKLMFSQEEYLFCFCFVSQLHS